jgi:hypothetical protein
MKGMCKHCNNGKPCIYGFCIDCFAHKRKHGFFPGGEIVEEIIESPVKVIVETPTKIIGICLQCKCEMECNGSDDIEDKLCVFCLEEVMEEMDEEEREWDYQQWINSDQYFRKLLLGEGLTVEQLDNTPEIIELKKMIVQTKRKLKEPSLSKN